MITLSQTSRALVKAKNPFMDFAPGLGQLVKLQWFKRGMLALKASRTAYAIATKRNAPDELVGKAIGNFVRSRITRPTTNRIVLGHKIATRRSFSSLFNGLSATHRTQVSDLDRFGGSRVVKKLYVMYHDANKAGRHLDVHIGHQSIVVRVSGKPVEKKLKFNSKGILTEESKTLLIQHLRDEISNNSRVVHNHDHTVSNAKCSWLEPTEGHYGAGKTRQPILIDKAELYHPHLKTSQHWYIPSLFPDQGTYIHEIYPGSKKTAPILIWGKLIPRDTKFKDRLHLKMISADELEKYTSKIDPLTNTRKYDGASAYFTTNGIGFKLFSPRYSKVTGHRIEYTYKVPELANIHNGTHQWLPGLPTQSSKTNGMGEMLFYRRNQIGSLLEKMFGIRGPEGWTWNYIPAAQIGGILNSNKVRPLDIYPEYRLYRIDKFNGEDTTDLPFFKNRALQHIVSTANPWFKVVKLSPVTKNTSWEGLVGVPKGLSVNDGLKIKWWQDPHDWEVIHNGFSLSEKGNIQGVITFRSLESGTEFKLGPGQVGSFDDCMSLLEMQGKTIGMAAKVQSRNGHEGRAAKLVEWHMDKGLG